MPKKLNDFPRHPFSQKWKLNLDLFHSEPTVSMLQLVAVLKTRQLRDGFLYESQTMTLKHWGKTKKHITMVSF